MKKIMIVGAGGVGGYIAGKLLQNAQDVTLVARGKHLEAIKKNGLKIIDEDSEFTVKPSIITANPKGLGRYDLIILAVKSYDLAGALEIIKENVSSDTILLPLLNGVEHDKEIKDVYKNAKVLNGCIYILSNIKEPGVIKKYGGVFHLMFGVQEKNLDEFQPLKELFDKAGLVSKPTSNIEFETWRKFLLVSSYAAINSYYKKPLGWVVENKMDELERVLNEIKSVANKKGIPIEEKNVQNVIDRAKKLPYNSKMSMQLDFEKGKKTEVETLCGFIVKEGEKVGVKTPVMKKIYEKLANH